MMLQPKFQNPKHYGSIVIAAVVTVTLRTGVEIYQYSEVTGFSVQTCLRGQKKKKKEVRTLVVCLKGHRKDIFCRMLFPCQISSLDFRNMPICKEKERKKKKKRDQEL